MVTSTPLTTSPDGARAEEGRDQESPLDRSRAKANRAQQAVADASRRVDDIDERLERIGAQTVADEKTLAAALDAIKRLKKALKDAGKERQKLVLSRKRAIADVEKAEEKARKAEAKYDREVLADLIERQKEHDRAASTPSVAVPGGAAPEAQLTGDGQAGAPSIERSAEPSMEPSTDSSIEPSIEPEDLGTATARATAARATADSAGEAAQPAPKPPTPRRSTRSRTPRSTASSPSASEAAQSSQAPSSQA